MFEGTLERIALETVQRLLHIDPEFLARQQEAMRQAQEQEARRRRQMQFSAPGEPGEAPQITVGNGAPAPQGFSLSATQAPVFSSPQASVQPARPLTGPMPGTVVQRPPQAMNPGMNPALKDIGRNDPCPCGSGKKFKKCHGQEA